MTVGAPHAGAPPWIARGALAIMALEVVALLAAGIMGPVLPLGVLGVSLYAVLCWVSLPAAWLVTLAAVPFSFEWYAPGLASALWLPTEPMIFVFIVVWGVRALLHGAHSLPRSPIIASIGVLALLSVVSGFGSRYYFLSFKAILSAAWFVVFAFLFPMTHGGEKNFPRRALVVLGVSGAAYAVYGLIYLAGHGLTRWTANEMGHPFFPEHGTYSVFLTFGLAALLALTFSAPRRLWRVLGFTGAGLIALAIVLALSRAAYLGLAAVFGISLWHLLRARRARLAVALIVVAIAAGYGVTRFRAGEFVGIYAASITRPDEPSNLERISRWLAAWNMANAHPLLGVGFGTYEENYYSYRVLSLRTQERFRRMGVHNEYFKILAEMGWLGFAAFLAFVALIFRQGNRAIHLARSPAERWTALGAVAGVASYLVHGFFNSYTGIDKVVIPLWFLISLVAFMGSRPPSPRGASSV